MTFFEMFSRLFCIGFCLAFLVAHAAPCGLLDVTAFTVTKPAVRSQVFTLCAYFVTVVSAHFVSHVFEPFCFNLQVALSSEVFALIYQTTRYQIPEDVI